MSHSRLQCPRCTNGARFMQSVSTDAVFNSLAKGYSHLGRDFLFCSGCYFTAIDTVKKFYANTQLLIAQRKQAKKMEEDIAKARKSSETYSSSSSETSTPTHSIARGREAAKPYELSAMGPLDPRSSGNRDAPMPRKGTDPKLRRLDDSSPIELITPLYLPNMDSPSQSSHLTQPELPQDQSELVQRMELVTSPDDAAVSQFFPNPFEPAPPRPTFHLDVQSHLPLFEADMESPSTIAGPTNLIRVTEDLPDVLFNTPYSETPKQESISTDSDSPIQELSSDSFSPKPDLSTTESEPSKASKSDDKDFLHTDNSSSLCSASDLLGLVNLRPLTAYNVGSETSSYDSAMEGETSGQIAFRHRVLPSPIDEADDNQFNPGESLDLQSDEPMEQDNGASARKLWATMTQFSKEEDEGKGHM